MSSTSNISAKLLVSKCPISRSSSVDSTVSTFSTSSTLSAASSVEAIDIYADDAAEQLVPGHVAPPPPLHLDSEGVRRWHSFLTYYYRVHLLGQIVREISYEKVFKPEIIFPDTDHIAIMCIIAIFKAVFLFWHPQEIPFPYLEFPHKFDWIKSFEVEADRPYEEEAIEQEPCTYPVAMQPIVEVTAAAHVNMSDADLSSDSDDTDDPLFNVSLDFDRPESILETSPSFAGRPDIPQRVSFPPNIQLDHKLARPTLSRPRSTSRASVDPSLPGAGWKRFDKGGKPYTFAHLANWVPPKEDPFIAFSWADNCVEATSSNLDKRRERKIHARTAKVQDEAYKARLLRSMAPKRAVVFRRTQSEPFMPTEYRLSTPMPPRKAFEIRRPSLDDVIEVDEVEITDESHEVPRRTLGKRLWASVSPWRAEEAEGRTAGPRPNVSGPVSRRCKEEGALMRKLKWGEL